VRYNDFRRSGGGKAMSIGKSCEEQRYQAELAYRSAIKGAKLVGIPREKHAQKRSKMKVKRNNKISCYMYKTLTMGFLSRF